MSTASALTADADNAMKIKWAKDKLSVRDLKQQRLKSSVSLLPAMICYNRKRLSPGFGLAV